MLEAGIYYFRIMVCDTGGLWSSYSDGTDSFVLDTIGQYLPVLYMYPEGNYVDINDSVTGHSENQVFNADLT